MPGLPIDSEVTSLESKLQLSRAPLLPDNPLKDVQLPHLPTVDKFSNMDTNTLSEKVQLNNVEAVATEKVSELDFKQFDSGEIADALDKTKAIKEKGAPLLNKDISGEVRKVQEGEYDESIEAAANDQLKKVDEAKVLENVDAPEKIVDDIQETANQFDPSKAEELARERIDEHFANKEEFLKKQMDDIAKFQLKYRDIADSRSLPKRPPNPMKGKPFVERLIPEIGFQVLHAENVSVDISPSIGYRFNGLLNAGVGGYHRVLYRRKTESVRLVDVYGLRAYTTVRVRKGIHAYMEVERFNSQDDCLRR